MTVQSVKELIVYKKAYQQAMSFFELSGQLPAEEKFALTSQGRRASRSVCQNLREIGKMLGSMLKAPDKFLPTPNP